MKVKKEVTTTSYFQARMDLLGISEADNKVKLWRNETVDNEHKDVLVDVPVFRELPEGIEILVYTLDRATIRIEKNGSRMKKDFSIIRLEKPFVKDNGDSMKYRLPKGAGTNPFFPPKLVDKFDKKTTIDTLYLVEGYFKAFKTELHGADIVGLSSITHMKGKDGKLHEDILRLMNTCSVRKVVWLTDGDALDITQRELQDGMDLRKRPQGFFSSVSTFKTLLEDYDVEKWFMHIDTDNIIASHKDIRREDVKGIDDLLVTFKGKEKDIIKDLTSFSSSSGYFQKFQITISTSKVYHHFHLRDVKDFYLYHVERRPELKNKEFIFNGTRYAYDEEKGECLVKIPGDAKLYFRVGDDYYKFVNIPNQYHRLERVFNVRRKATITDDHGKDFTKHIPKYEAFCNVPDHFDFKQVIHNCFNVYSPVDYLPDEEESFAEDCPTIMEFLHHLFGENKVYYKGDGEEKKEYRMVDMALDYLQLIYQKPQQKLPILCLVSKENNTGKSTFGNFLRMMIGANTAIVGNADLVNDFNAHWVTKNVVVCDETKIDKVTVVEKVKSLSTARKIFMNAKGKGQVELDCFIKFVLITNNEENFISLTDQDIRYWVIKVPVLSKKENPDILDQFVAEMPSFLSFLNRRKMVTEKKNRMWFHPSLLKTEALRKVIAFSQPTIEKELRHYFKEVFLDTGVQEILMTQQAIHKEVFNNRYEKNYLANVLNERLKVDARHVWLVDGIEKEYLTKEEAMAAAEVKHPDVKGFMIEGYLKKKYKVCRHSYPKMEEIMGENGRKEMKRVQVTDNGRPLVFKREDFVKEEDNVIVDPGAENEFITKAISSIEGPATAEKLPF